MKLRQISLAVAFAAVAGSAQALPWVGFFQTSNSGTGGSLHDGVVGPFSGFNLIPNGSAAFFCNTPAGCGIGGAVPNGAQINPGSITAVKPGDNILTRYQGIVSNFKPSAPAPNLLYPGLNRLADPYQITLAAMFGQTVSNVIDGTTVHLTANKGGRFGFYYDDINSPTGGLPGTAANIAAGAGFTDGLEILGGVIDGGFSTITVSPGSGPSGSVTITGTVTSRKIGTVGPDTVGFMPDAPDGNVYTTTIDIQYGRSTADNTDHRTRKFFDAANGWTPIGVNRHLTVRAHADTVFRRVPEPTTLALLGLGLAGLGLSLRRRAA